MTFDLHTPKLNLGCVLIPWTFISNFIKIRQTLPKLLIGIQNCYGRTDARKDGRQCFYIPSDFVGEGIMINPRKSRSQHDSLSAILVLVDEYSFFLFERPIATYESARLDQVTYEYS